MALSRRHFLIAASITPIASALPLPALAAVPPVYAERGVAVDGTDVLSYFQGGAPLQGSSDFSADWNGATWHFTTAANRNLFMANPWNFAPQYGGYCAYAVSEGNIASTVPHAWKIVDGKLYLNYSRRFHRRWERDIPARIAAADVHWPRLIA